MRQPFSGRPTTIRVKLASIAWNFPVHEASVTTCFTLPRVKRSARSLSVSCDVAGMITAPIFIAASIVSQSSQRLPNMTSIRSPRLTPSADNEFATRFEISESSANVCDPASPSSEKTRSAIPRFPLAKTSNQSSAQLKSSNSGHRKPR